MSSMCAAALPQGTGDGRPNDSTNQGMVAMLASRIRAASERKEPKNTNSTAWSTKAWNSYEYRARVPTLAQFDRDKSSRKRQAIESTAYNGLFNMGTNNAKVQKAVPKPSPAHIGGKWTRSSDGSNDSGSKSKEMTAKETKVPLKMVGVMARDKSWLHKVKKSFVKKFYAPSTLATKNTKRKKVAEILENMGGDSFPLNVDNLTALAATLDSTGMKAGDQYLAEAKAMHVEAGHQWDLQLDKQMSACRRALQRDKGPEVRAKEVKLSEISEETWQAENPGKGEPRRVAWSFAWAMMWMLRAIEASQIMAKDLELDQDHKTVKLFIKKSKTDQKASGTWRTLACCGKSPCARDCAFKLASIALEDLRSNSPDSPLFPDGEGHWVSKLHMVTAWSAHLDEGATGHSARRSGAMHYARRGTPIQSIQFLGRWKSSAVFRYVEEAMMEIPLNRGWIPEKDMEPDKTADAKQEKYERKACRPKRKAAPKMLEESPEKPTEVNKPLIDDAEKDKVFALSKSRGKWTKHLVGQAAWGIPLDNWSTVCGWNFARKNVKVELTQKPTREAVPCKKCFKLMEGRDGVKGAREWAPEMAL